MTIHSKQYHLAVRVLLLAAVFFAGSAQCFEFRVNPLRIYLDSKTKSATVVLENLSDHDVTMQARMNSWSQGNGPEDVIVPTDDVVVSPPIFKIQAKSRQLVRVGNLKKPDATLEGAYRLYLDEVPPPRKPDEQNIAVALRISVPVFISPVSGKAKPAVTWKAEAVDEKNIKLILLNAGSAHIQVTGISAVLPDGSTLGVLPQMMTYLLPLNSHVYNLKTEKPWAGETLRVMIKSDTAPYGVETEVSPQ
jgi:fimbrial chaperone protein